MSSERRIVIPSEERNLLFAGVVRSPSIKVSVATPTDEGVRGSRGVRGSTSIAEIRGPISGIRVPRNFLFVLFEIFLAAGCPARRHLHGSASPRSIRGILRTLVKGHDDVRAEPDLGFHGALRAEEVRRAIQMRAERHSLFLH